jgi:L-2-hydroxyglutarate oxidase LhgO
MSSYDFVVIGAGVFGLSIARSIKINRPELRVLVLEKESEVGKHTSGRNSGVLHQGIYYSPDSLKAKLCIAGAKQIEAFCIEKKLPLKKIGKVILPLKKTDDVELKRLLERAQKNGAKIRLIDQKEITAIEPEAVSLTGFGLHSPETSVIDPLITLNALLEDARSKGVAICFNAPVFNAKPKEKYVELGPEKIPYGHLINASGLFADKVAHIFDVGKNYRLFPFRGIYSKLTENCPLKIRGLIYPVPDLRVPVLGVHFTPSIAGGIYIGPTALPALGRENYRGLEGIESHEFFPMLIPKNFGILHS